MTVGTTKGTQRDPASPRQRVETTLLIGPSPPPYGGARVSFQLFYEFLSDLDAEGQITYLDLPARKSRDTVPPGGVDHLRTGLGILKNLGKLVRADRLVVFGSRNFCFSYALFLLAVGKLLGKPGRVRFFGGHPASVFAGNSFLRLAAMRLMGLAERLVVETDVAVTEFPEFLHPKIDVVHAYRRSAGQRPDESEGDVVRFVYVGHITAAKGVPDLVSAFRLVNESESLEKKVELHVYGAGDDQVVHRLSGVENLHYHGRVPQEQLVAELMDYQAMVFPSAYENEGHPGVIVEALMAGMPIIATNLPGPMEILSDGVNSRIVEVNDVSALASAMRELASDAELRSQFARQSGISGRQFDARVVLPELARALGISIGTGGPGTNPEGKVRN